MSVYVSVVVPIYNEQESIRELVNRVAEVLSDCEFNSEIVLVDDGSTDGSWKVIEDLKALVSHLRGIKLRRNYGQTSAMAAGFDEAVGQVIVVMDGDLQNDPSDIPRLVEKISEGYDIVSGWRRERKDHVSRVIPSRIANAIISFTTGVHLHDYGCSLKAYRTECIKLLKPYGEMHRFLPAFSKITGARVAEIPVKHHRRKYGKSKYGFGRIPKVFSDIFVINLIIRFSSNPLKGFVLWAVPFCVLAMFFGLLGLLAVLFHWTPGKAFFFVVSSALSAMAVIHLVVLGMLGELVVGAGDSPHTRIPIVVKRVLERESMETIKGKNSGWPSTSRPGVTKN